MTDLAITAAGLRKRYRDTAALDGFDMTVRSGTVHGLLGPNGAGKTTVVRVLATLLRFDAGQATVAGFDVHRQGDEVRRRIALTGQYAAVDETLSGRQNLVMLGRLWHLGRDAARRRAAELLEQFELLDVADRSAGQYSGGMVRRLDVAASFVLRPEVLFLDEPTAGLDPRSRDRVWAAVRALVGDGTTVLLTTQHLEEADQLADQISVLDAGRVVAAGTADELKARVGGDRIEVVVRDVGDLALAASIVSRAAGKAAEADTDSRRVSAPVADRISTLSKVVRTLHDTGVDVEDISLRRPTLDEAFLHLTGHMAREGEVA